jgi:MoaA/NifB/PqqE/SkfB family radical SAM enzyme
MNDGAIDLAGWLKILEEYKVLCRKLGKRPDFILCGGEPTISKLLRPILEKIASDFPDAPVAILSNGTMLRPGLVEYLKKFNVHFQVSLDGPEAESHDKVRGPGAFMRALKGIALLRSENISVSILSILSKRTSSQIRRFFDLAAKIDVSSMNFTRLIGEGTARNLVEEGQDAPIYGLELKEAMEEILKQSKAHSVHTSTNAPLYALLDRNLGRNGQYGFQGIIVDYKGNLKVSSRTPTILGNVLAEGLEKLFMESPIMKALRDRAIEGCGSCPLYGRCGGDRNASFGEYGSYLKKDPGCWK